MAVPPKLVLHCYSVRTVSKPTHYHLCQIWTQTPAFCTRFWKCFWFRSSYVHFAPNPQKKKSRTVKIRTSRRPFCWSSTTNPPSSEVVGESLMIRKGKICGCTTLHQTLHNCPADKQRTTRNIGRALCLATFNLEPSVANRSSLLPLRRTKATIK